jgi:hypothetical protein
MTYEKIDFYQEVEVWSGSKLAQYRGLKGVVMGISEEDQIVYGYAVLLHGMDQTTYFDKDDLIPTGVRYSRDDFY